MPQRSEEGEVQASRTHWPIRGSRTIGRGLRPSPMTKTAIARRARNSHEIMLRCQQLHCRFMHARIAGCDNAAAALSRLAVPSGDDPAGAGDDRNESRNVVGFQFGLDDEIEMAGGEHAVGITIAAITRQPHALLDASE